MATYKGKKVTLNKPRRIGKGETSYGKKKYVAGAKNPKAREREIKRTAKLYREGKLTPAMMERISKKRSKS